MLGSLALNGLPAAETGHVGTYSCPNVLGYKAWRQFFLAFDALFFHFCSYLIFGYFADCTLHHRFRKLK